MEPDENDEDGEQQEVELLRPARELVAKEVQRIDVGNAVRSAGQSFTGDRWIPDVDEDDEGLTEEQRDDREVVAQKPPRRQPEDEA